MPTAPPLCPPSTSASSTSNPRRHSPWRIAYYHTGRPPARPVWIDLAEAVLRRAGSIHPSLALIAAAQFPNVDLPYPLFCMAAGLAALGPLQNVQETAQTPAHSGDSSDSSPPVPRPQAVATRSSPSAMILLLAQPFLTSAQWGDALHLQPQLVSLEAILSRIQAPPTLSPPSSELMYNVVSRFSPLSSPPSPQSGLCSHGRQAPHPS